MIIIDTHILLWSILTPERLKNEYKVLLTDPDNDVFLSVASIWESQIKQKIGKLDLPGDAVDYLTDKCKKLKIKIIGIEVETIQQLGQLPLIHNDPFDRIIISSSLQHNMKLITEDGKIRQYDLNNLL